MADDLPAGSVSLEDGPATPAPAPAPPPPAAAAPPAPAAEPVEPEAVDVGGEQMVPLRALIAERNEKKALKERGGQLEQYYNQTKPYVDFINANPGLLKQPQPQHAPPAPAAEVDPDVVMLAETLSLYNPDGSLNTKGAEKILQVAEKRSDKRVQAAIQPHVQQTAQERSARNFHQALNTTMPNGVKPDQVALTNLWRSLPAHLTADPNVATILQLAATGAAVMGAPQRVAPAPNAPLVSEPSGGQPRPGGGRLTQLERDVAATRGISETKWGELGKGFTAGRSSQIEE